MKDYYEKSCRDGSKAISELQTEIEKNRQRVANAQQLMVDGELYAADYKEIKARYETVIQKLEREMNGISKVDNNLIEYVNAAVDILRNLPGYFKNASLPVQQKIVGSIFMNKLVFEENECRTPQYNEVIEWICGLDAASGGLKKEQASENRSLSKVVIPLGWSRLL